MKCAKVKGADVIFDYSSPSRIQKNNSDQKVKYNKQEQLPVPTQKVASNINEKVVANSMLASLSFGLFKLTANTVFLTLSCGVKVMTVVSEAVLKAAVRVNLENPIELRDFFNLDPHSCLLKLLDLLEKDPKAAEKIFLSLATTWTKDPKQFFCYSNLNRPTLIEAIDEIMLKLLLTPGQYQVEERVTMGELSDAEGFAISVTDDEWKNSPKTPAATEIRAKNLENQTLKKSYQEKLWGSWYARIQSADRFDENNFADLNLDQNFENPIRKQSSGGVSFGNFLERVINYRKDSIENLKKEKVFNGWATYTKEFLYNVMMDETVLKEFPRFEILVKKMYKILADEDKRKHLYKIVSKVTDITQGKLA